MADTGSALTMSEGFLPRASPGTSFRDITAGPKQLAGARAP